VALAEGSVEISAGAGALADGADELASGLLSGADAIPSYSSDDRARLEAVAVSPIAYAEADAPPGNIAMLLSLGIAGLWLGTLAVFVVAQPVSHRVLLAATSSSRIVVGGLLPAAVVGAVLATTLSVAAWLLLDLAFSRVAALLGMLLLAAVVFAAVNQALAAIGGGWGHVVAVAALGASAAVAYVSALPGAFTSIAGVLPTSVALGLGKAAAAGSSLDGGQVALLVVWCVIAAVLSFVSVARRRTVRVDELEALAS